MASRPSQKLDHSSDRSSIKPTNSHNLSHNDNILINDSLQTPNTTTMLYSRIECQSSKDEQNLSDLTDFLSNTKPNNKAKKSIINDNFHRHSKSLTDAVITKFALRENPRFFEPLLKSKDPIMLTSPQATIKTIDEIIKEDKNKCNKVALKKSKTSPDKQSNDTSLTRQNNTVKVHIVTPVIFRPEDQINEFLENEESLDSDQEEPYKEKTNISKDSTNFSKDHSKITNDPSKISKETDESIKPTRKSFGSLKEELKKAEDRMSLSKEKVSPDNKENNSSSKPITKKKKRISLEEKLEEKFKKLAEEKKNRHNSETLKKAANSESNKSLKINDFLEQKYKELRLQKLGDMKNGVNAVTRSEDFIKDDKIDKGVKTRSFDNLEVIEDKTKLDFKKKEKSGFSEGKNEKIKENHNKAEENVKKAGNNKIIEKNSIKAENNEEIVEIFKKPRKSEIKTPSVLSDIKKRAKSTCLSLLSGGLKTDNNQNQSILMGNYNKKLINIDSMIPDKKIFEDRKVQTPTFEQSESLSNNNSSKNFLQHNNTVDLTGNHSHFYHDNFPTSQNDDKNSTEDINLSDNKIIVKMNENGAVIKIDQSKKKSNLKSSVIGTFSGKASRSRSVAFKVDDFSKVLEFDETESSIQIQNTCSQNNIINKELVINQSVNSVKNNVIVKNDQNSLSEANTVNLKNEPKEDISKIIEVDPINDPIHIKDSTFIQDINNITDSKSNKDSLNQNKNIDDQANNIPIEHTSEFYETVQIPKKKSICNPNPNKNRSISLERQFNSSLEDRGFKSCDEDNNKKSHTLTDNKCLRISAFLKKPTDPEDIQEVSNDNSPISGPKANIKDAETLDIQRDNMIIKPIPIEKNEAIRGSLLMKPGYLNNKRPSSVQYIRDEDLFNYEGGCGSFNNDNDDSSGDDISSEESDGRKIMSENNLEFKSEATGPSKFKKLVKKPDEDIKDQPRVSQMHPIMNEASPKPDEGINEESVKDQNNDVQEIETIYKEEEENNDVKSIEGCIESNYITKSESEIGGKGKIDTKLQVKALFEAKKSMEKPKIKKPINSKNLNGQWVNKPINKTNDKPYTISKLNITDKSKNPAINKPVDIKPAVTVNEKTIIIEKDKIISSQKTIDKKEVNKNVKEHGFEHRGVSQEVSELMEETLLYEAKLEEILRKISLRTFLWVKTIIRPHEDVYKVSKALLHLILLDKHELNHWKKIQVFFNSPADLLASMQTFKQNIYRNKLLKENIEKSKENIIDTSQIDPSLTETKIFKEYVLLINDFLINAHKFHSLIQTLHSKLGTSVEDLSVLITPPKAKQQTTPAKSQSPTIKRNSPTRRCKTPEQRVIKWTIGQKDQIEIDDQRGDHVIKDIIEKSFEKKVEKGHCFVYESCEKEMDRSWKELLNLRSEITRLLWEEERRVKRTKEREEKSTKKNEIEYTALEKKEMERLLEEKEREEKRFVKEMKEQQYKELLESKKEEIVTKKIEVFDDLKRSNENSKKLKACKEQSKLNSKLEIKSKKEDKFILKKIKIEQKIDLDSSNLENLLRIQNEEKLWKLKQMELNKKALKKTLTHIKTLVSANDDYNN